jgi:exopolysaccharide production protein ExoZ
MPPESSQPSSAARSNPQKYVGIQSLRFVAAALVLISHITFVIHERLDNTLAIWDKGTVGVYLFFAISGFVMIKATEKAPLDWIDFIKRRTIRVAPLYWLATTIKLAVVMMSPQLALHSAFDVTHALSSYLFFQHPNQNGEMSPLHAVGWTLNYEMFFYLALATCLAFKLNAVMTLTALFSLMAAAFSTTDLNGHPIIRAYLMPISLQFILGCWIAKISTYLDARSNAIRLTLGIACTLGGALALIFYSNDIIEARNWDGFLRAGMGSAALVLGVVLLEPLIGRKIPTLVTQLGDSSYSLYLFHPFILGALILILSKLAPTMDAISAIAIMLGFSLAGAHLLYVFVEQPLTRQLTNRLMGTNENIQDVRNK